MKYGKEEFDGFWQAAMRWKKRKSFNKDSFFEERFRSPEFVGFGGTTLRRVTERLDEIAAMAGGLSVGILPLEDGEKKKFAGVVDADALAELSEPNTYGIGAVKPLSGESVSGADRFRPVGAMIFRIDKRSDDGTYFAVLRWLYVEKEERGRGVASRMMEKLFLRIVDAGIEYVEVMVDPEEENRNLAEFLAGWGFDMEGAFVSRIRLTIRGLREHFGAYFKRYDPVGEPLSEVPYELVKQRIRAISNDRDSFDTEAILERESSYFDMNISCASFSDGKPEHMLLVARRPSGILSPVFVSDVTEENREIILGLILRVIEKAEGCYNRRNPVVIEGKHKRAVRLIADLFPEEDMTFVLQGVRAIADNSIWRR